MQRTTYLIISLLISLGLRAGVSVGSLTTEGQVNPLSIETQHPRLSWIITSNERDVMQTAYHVLVASSPEKLAAGIQAVSTQTGRSGWSMKEKNSPTTPVATGRCASSPTVVNPHGANRQSGAWVSSAKAIGADAGSDGKVPSSGTSRIPTAA